MNRIVAELHQAWDGRTRREQQLLAGMALLAMAVALWLGVVRPLNDWRDEAGRDRARAEADLVEVRTALVRLAPASSGPRRGEPRPVRTPPGPCPAPPPRATP